MFQRHHWKFGKMLIFIVKKIFDMIFSNYSFNSFKGLTICAPGDRGRGGNCDCSSAKGWVEGKWPTLNCHEGLCYAIQENDQCKGKDNGYQLGDGTWCWDSYRITKCITTSGKIT